MGDWHTSHCPIQICIVAHGEFGVCDGHHTRFVMKKAVGVGVLRFAHYVLTHLKY
jgi:hypothetical protein